MEKHAMLNQLSSYPAAEQMAALRMCLNPSMQQVVEIVLGISSAPTTPPHRYDVLDRIGNHVRKKRNVALDRVAFKEFRQGMAESFDEFYIAASLTLQTYVVRALTVEWTLASLREFGIWKQTSLSARFQRLRQRSTYFEARNRPGQTRKFGVRKVSPLFESDRVESILHHLHPSAMLVDGHSTLSAKPGKP